MGRAALSAADLWRAEQGELAVWLRRGASQAMEMRYFGDVVATRTASDGSPHLCRVYFASDALIPHLDALLAWYAAVGHRPRFDLLPTLPIQALTQALGRRGFTQIGFKSVMAAPLHFLDLPLPAPSVEIVPLSCADAEAIGALYAAAFGFSPAQNPARAASLTALCHSDAAQFYGVWQGDELGAFGLLVQHEGLGFIATAATQSHWRGRGFQSALLARRVMEGAAAGCDFFAGQTEPYSPSQRNMARLGLQLAATKALWAAG